MINPDGTASCDRCNDELPGIGIIYGMVAVSVEDDRAVQRIFCYDNGCAAVVLAAGEPG